MLEVTQVFDRLVRQLACLRSQIAIEQLFRHLQPFLGSFLLGAAIAVVQLLSQQRLRFLGINDSLFHLIQQLAKLLLLLCQLILEIDLILVLVSQSSAWLFRFLVQLFDDLLLTLFQLRRIIF